MTDDIVVERLLAKFFEPKIRYMGGNLRIVELSPSYITVEERDVIVKALKMLRLQANEISDAHHQDLRM